MPVLKMIFLVKHDVNNGNTVSAVMRGMVRGSREGFIKGSIRRAEIGEGHKS
jgi:hypothetical protein